MSTESKTNYRKAFKTPYLSSADILGSTRLTVSHVQLELDKTDRTKGMFNTAYFSDSEIRPGELIKPMILNVVNCKTLKDFTKSPFIEDWVNVNVTVYVDSNVKFGREITEGLRIQIAPPLKLLTPDDKKTWDRAKAAFLKDGNLDAVIKHMFISDENKDKIIEECRNEMA